LDELGIKEKIKQEVTKKKPAPRTDSISSFGYNTVDEFRHNQQNHHH
jgi:hypothetical protein